MAIIKCKMCGGELEIVEGSSTARCEYCDSLQTIPKVDDEKKLTLFARGNRLRAACEFDKAAGIYESIVADFPDEAEAYWGLVLCKYGIEYVDDPGTGKKIPTCHRSSFDSILDDSDLEQAMENADPAAQKVYRQEAKEFERIRKGILEVSSTEKPYDIFICYKETDEKGDRTLDSVLAQDLYSALTDKGYRVFFSRITLQGKLGEAYEPYIFAALNSAKVMLAVGTCYEYYNAVWVKNEWSRYLKICAADKSKHLIPCYKGLDPEDMPKEFSHLQGADLGKMGAVQDILFNMEKYIPLKKESAPVVVQQVSTANPTVDSYLERAFMFLEDGDWASADEYCEKVLDLDPKNAMAYLGKLMTKLHVKKQEQLKEQENPFDGVDLYQKAIRFGDDALKATLSGYITHINDRNKEAAYQEALALMKKFTITDLEKARNKFRRIPGYKDADALAKECVKKAEELRKEGIYKNGCAFMKKNTVANFEKAKKEFSSISGYKDADDLIKECDSKIAEIHANAEIARKKKNTKTAIIAAGVCAAVVFLVVLITVIIPNVRYNNAVALMEEEKYEEAIEIFQALDGYKDSSDKIEQCKTGILDLQYNDAVSLMEAGNHRKALAIFHSLDNYKDSAQQITLLRTTLAQRETVSAGSNHTVGLKADGTVVAVGKNIYGQCDVDGWNNIIAVSAGSNHTVGLKADGTVVAVGKNDSGQCDVGGWKDIIAVSAGKSHTVGLKADGTVVAVGKNTYDQCYVTSWNDIIAVSAGFEHTVGLKASGAVVAVGDHANGRCNVFGWNNIIAVSADSEHTVGLKANGSAVRVGLINDGRCDVDSWTDIIAISTGTFHTAGLKADGTVVAVGENNDGQCDVADWTDIIAICAGSRHTIGLKADGTVVAVGENNDGQCEVDDWTGIKLPE